MGESICINISGTAFSLLLYENIRSKYDQEGFLLGEVITKEKRAITDNDQEVINIEKIIKINSVIPCPTLAYFYDNAGRINKHNIKNFLGPEASKVVCWYKFKHTASFKLTIREKIVMKQLANFIFPKNPQHFTCCLLTTEISSDTSATHLYSQTFIRYHNSNFQPVPMHIINLKDPHDLYKTPEDCSKTFKGIVKSLKVDTESSHGYTIVSKLEKALDTHITKVVEELSEAEKKLYDLEQEVKRLKENVVEEEEEEENDELDDVFGILDNDCSNECEVKDDVKSKNVNMMENSKNAICESVPIERKTRSYSQAMQKNKT